MTSLVLEVAAVRPLTGAKTCLTSVSGQVFAPLRNVSGATVGGKCENHSKNIMFALSISRMFCFGDISASKASQVLSTHTIKRLFNRTQYT